MKIVLLLLSFLYLTFNGTSQSSVSDRIQSYWSENKKIKFFRIKVKANGSKQYFYFNKQNNQFIAFQKFDITEGKLTRYYFKNEQLIFIIYQPKKDSTKQKKGGLFYFVNGKLEEKEEYGIESFDPSHFLTKADKILDQAHSILKTRK